MYSGNVLGMLIKSSGENSLSPLIALYVSWKRLLNDHQACAFALAKKSALVRPFPRSFDSLDSLKGFPSGSTTSPEPLNGLKSTS